MTIVPAPRSRPLKTQGCAAAVLPCLKRVKPVTKSATAGSGQRLDPEAHYESFEVNPIMSPVKGLISFDGTNL